MVSKRHLKQYSYLVIALMSIILVAAGIWELSGAIGEKSGSKIALRAIFLLCWIALGIANWHIYKKEKRKNESSGPS